MEVCVRSSMVFCLGTTWSNVSLYRIDFTCVTNWLWFVTKRLVSKRLCTETTVTRLAWRVLTLADENYRGEPHEILVKCLKTLSHLICTQKKRQIPNGISKHFIHWSIYELFYSSPRKKQSWNKRRFGQMNSNFFKKELASSFFPVNLSGVNFLWQPKIDISETSLKLLKSLHFR